MNPSHSSHRGTLRSTSRVANRRPTGVPARRHRAIDGVSLKASAPATKQTIAAPSVTQSVPHHIHRSLAKTAKRTDIMRRIYEIEREVVQRRERERQHPLRRFFSQQVVFGALTAVIIAVTGYVSIDTWLTNREVKAEVVGATSQETKQQKPKTHQEREGGDETPLPKDVLKNYSVAAATPRALYINKLGIAARLMPMGVNTDGSLQAPINIFDAGWYTGSDKPGRTGAMVIDAHASGRLRLGLFAYLDTLKKGDTVEIETGNMKRYKYRVVATETVAKEKVNMKKLMLPYGHALEGANFITCTGEWQQKGQTYDKRAIVYTERIK